MAHQRSWVEPAIDHVVACELWVLVRTFPLRRRKVVVNVMREERLAHPDRCGRRRDLNYHSTNDNVLKYLYAVARDSSQRRQCFESQHSLVR